MARLKDRLNKMKTCPNCKEKTIPFKWVIFNKSKSGIYSKCFQCPNCKEKIRKNKNFIIFILSGISNIELVWILLIGFFINYLTNSLFLTILGVIMTFIILEYVLEYITPLSVAKEGYCSDEMTRIGAVFALLLMAFIIGFLIYCFIISPFVLNTGFCAKGN